ncbi:MAG: phosphomannomutase [Gemmatimonas sp.]|nr:phosphomannomutase [Gemmatimonas sp.]
MPMNPHIFRQYDVRGVVGQDIDAGVATDLGRAFGTRLRREGFSRPRVTLGRDNRLSSDELASALRSGLTSVGAQVIDVGMVPTPVLYFASAVAEADGAIQVTGSHNPPEYNGFKLSIGGRSIYGETIQEVRRLIEAGDFEVGQGGWESKNILPTYIADLSGRFPVERPVRVVVDCGNGTGSVVAVDLLQALGAKVGIIPIFCESDGTFPNHHPDPVVDENLADLRARVVESGADLGIAFDGDADRIGAVDERGEIVRGDTLLALFALDLLERRGSGQKVVFDVKCSQALSEVIEGAGGVPIMSATGHSLIKERMKKEGALLAGELSGHICFGEDYYGFDDALYAACLLISIVSRSPEPMSQRIATFPTFVSTSELRYPASEERKWKIVDRAVRHFSTEHDVVDVDGARVLFDDGWGLIRASNTEPVLVARYEARTPEALERIRETMEGWVRAQGIPVSS